MITVEQIRAARALLNWNQSDLADKAGLSLPSINNIERQIGSPRVSTMETIRITLSNAGIEFIGNNGVQKHSEVFEMKEFQGDDFIEKLNDDLFFCMRSPEDVVMMFGIDDSMYVKYVPEQTIRYYDHQAKTGFTERTLLRENDNFFLSDQSIYRWIGPQSIGLVPYYVYKDRVAMIMWDVKRVIIIRSQAIAETYRAQFEFLWEQAKPIPKGTPNRSKDPKFQAKKK